VPSSAGAGTYIFPLSPRTVLNGISCPLKLLLVKGKFLPDDKHRLPYMIRTKWAYSTVRLYIAAERKTVFWDTKLEQPPQKQYRNLLIRSWPARLAVDMFIHDLM
jgi:hypothetical protein